MFTLSSFYRSKEWENLRAQLRLQRVNNNGDVICEYCNTPIVKQYDIIAHHKIHLTQSNVNDYSISLNPSNIQLVHFKCHNAIHNKGFKSKRVYIVYGSPCAGKTYYVHSVATNNDLIIDIDKIYNALCLDRNDNKVLNTVMSVYRYLIDVVKTRNGQWQNAYIVRSLPYAIERQRLADLVDAELIFIDTDKNTCLQRSKSRGENYYQLVEDWFNKYQQ